jgi:hypothetical protein
MTKPISRAELGRLGKRGSYRLGTLAPQGIPPLAQPRPFRPSFSKARHAGPASVWVLAALAGTALNTAGAMLGLWFVPLVIGVLTGIAAGWAVWPLRVTAPVVVLMSAGGWGAALWAYSLRGQPVGATARVIAAIAGLPAHAVVAIGATLAVSVLLGLAGLWLGRALTPRSRR